MKKIILLLFILFSVQLLFAQSDSKVVKGKHLPEATVQANYTCPMLHEVTSDKPGTCTKCGMDLAKQKAPKKMQQKPGPHMKPKS
jgi:hypothetical protein